MLIAKGYRVALRMDDGRIVRPRGALLHDESGQAFPRGRVLIAGFKKTGKPVRKTKFFGPDYQPHEGVLSLPGDRSQLVRLSSWRVIGDVEHIEYDRVGEHAAAYEHDFRNEAMPRLWKRAGAYCLELRRGTVFSWRGFVEPGQ